MSIEEIEINKDNLDLQSYLTVTANLLESYNKKIADSSGDLELKDLKQIMQDVNEAFSLFQNIKNTTLETDLSTVQLLDQDFKTKNTDLTQKIESLNTVLLDLETKLQSDYFKGDSFVYDMFTPEQLLALKGEQGIQGIQGLTGDAFTYNMFTPEQLEALRGEQGIQGEVGESFLLDYTLLADYQTTKNTGDVVLSEIYMNFDYLLVFHSFYDGNFKKFEILPTHLLELNSNYCFTPVTTHYFQMKLVDNLTFSIVATSNGWLRQIYGLGRK